MLTVIVLPSAEVRPPGVAVRLDVEVDDPHFAELRRLDVYFSRTDLDRVDLAVGNLGLTFQEHLRDPAERLQPKNRVSTERKGSDASFTRN